MISLLLGGCVGSLVYAEVLERKGRVKVIMEGSIIMILSCIVGYFSINIYMFLFCAFWFGFGSRAYFNASIIYLSEITSENLRILAPCILYMGKGFGQIFISGLAYIHSGWYNILLIYTAIPLIFLTYAIRNLKESPNYLVVKK